MASGLPVSSDSLKSVLHGREAMIDDVVNDVEHGRTLFALEGVTGVGKSALMTAVSRRLECSGFSGVATLNAAQLVSEEFAIAAIYVQLQQLARDPEALINALKERVTSKLPQILKTLWGAVMADVAKLVTDKAEKTIEAIQGIVAGEGASPSVEGQLATLDRDNRRYFLSEFLQALVDGGNRVVIAIDNFDTADVGLASLIRFLIKSKPSGVALVLAHNNEVGDNTDWDNALADLKACRGRVFQVTPLDRSAIGAWFYSEIGRWPTVTELEELEDATHGRAMALKLAIDAIHDGVEQPIQPDYTGYYECSRHGLSAEAWTVAELLAVINRDASVPKDLLAAAAQNLEIGNIGPALDELHGRRLMKAHGGNVALAHSLAQQSWLATINGLRRRRLALAWFDVVADYDIAQLTGPEATGLIPVIITPLLERRPLTEIAAIGERMIAAGQIRAGLELLDRSWKATADGGTGGVGVIQHALIAARTRLELGRYGEVDEPLTLAGLAAGDESDARVQVLLLRMKLALRRNTYPALWILAKQLEAEPGQDLTAQIEGLQILNVGYRDLLDLGGVRASSNRLLELRDATTPQQQNAIDRTLARSFAKLGDADTALIHAQAAVDSSSALGSIRVVGNSDLALAEVLRYRRDYEPAVAAYRRAAAIGRATGNRDSLLWSLLGEAAAHIESGMSNKALGPLEEVKALLAEPGYDHPLETAHAGLLRALARTTDTAAEVILQRYEPLGINWPAEYLTNFVKSGRLAGPTPI